VYVCSFFLGRDSKQKMSNGEILVPWCFVYIGCIRPVPVLAFSVLGLYEEMFIALGASPTKLVYVVVN
jgi:hypothetical protein